MLCLTAKFGERIKITPPGYTGPDIWITVASPNNGGVLLVCDAPREVAIDREKVARWKAELLPVSESTVEEMKNEGV